uniref:Carbonic anhydrase n=1 Tax=Parascaris univalens TaxID=6257 RepID=A0A915B0I9_PARUN
LDTIGKMLQVAADRKQSPIDILPSVTAFDSSLEDATFNLKYPTSGQFKLVNAGESLKLHLGADLSGEFTASFIKDQRFALELVLIHWGTEPMNGSEHTVGGVGYAGEVHFIHRNMHYANIDQAFKESDGVVAVAVLLNESHDDNPTFAPIVDGITQIVYKGSECAIQRIDLRQLLPPPEKMREFWVYDGSETIAPFRENVQWIIYRSTVSISSHQLDKLRTLRKEGYESEVEHGMLPIRPVQPLNGRIVRSSFRAAAQAPPIEHD